MKLLHIGLDGGKTPDTSIMKTLKRHVKHYRDIHTGNPNRNELIIQYAKEFKPDFVFMQLQTEGVVSPEALKALHDCGSFVCNFSGDVRYPLPRWYIETGKLIDLTLFTNMNDVNEARKKGINADFCVMGYDPDIYKPDYNVKKDIEIAFFGNNYGNQFPLSRVRSNMVQQLKAVYGNRFKVFGNGWAKPDGNLNHSQPEEAKVLQRCKIAINISHFEYIRYSSDRLNRTLGCGVFCLTHEFPEMDKLGLIDYISCGVWNNTAMLQQRINYYLTNELERENIAKAGYKKAVELLTFDKMIEQVLSFYKPKVVA